MKVGIIDAAEEEVTLLRDKIKNRQAISLGGCEIYTDQLNGTEVAFLESGIGKVAAALDTASLLEHCKLDAIISTDSAGGLAPMLKMGDIVVSNGTRYHDADATAFGYEHGQLPGRLIGSKADDKLIAAVEACIVELNLNAARDLIVSDNAFINGSIDLARIRHNFPQATVVEMEATIITHVCYNFNVPLVIIHVVSDAADQQSYPSFGEFLVAAAKQSSPMVESLVQEPAHGQVIVQDASRPVFSCVTVAQRHATRHHTLSRQHWVRLCRRDYAGWGQQLFQLSSISTKD